MPYKTTGKHVAESTDESIVREQLYRTYPLLCIPKKGSHS